MVLIRPWLELSGKKHKVAEHEKQNRERRMGSSHGEFRDFGSGKMVVVEIF